MFVTWINTKSFKRMKLANSRSVSWRIQITFSKKSSGQVLSLFRCTIKLSYSLHRPHTLINLYYKMSYSEGDDSDGSCEGFPADDDEREGSDGESIDNSTDRDAKSGGDENTASELGAWLWDNSILELFYDCERRAPHLVHTCAAPRVHLYCICQGTPADLLYSSWSCSISILYDKHRHVRPPPAWDVYYVWE